MNGATSVKNVLNQNLLPHQVVILPQDLKIGSVWNVVIWIMREEFSVIVVNYRKVTTWDEFIKSHKYFDEFFIKFLAVIMKFWSYHSNEFIIFDKKINIVWIIWIRFLIKRNNILFKLSQHFKVTAYKKFFGSWKIIQ